MVEVMLALDSCRRVSIGSLVEASVTHRIARRFDDGSVVLEPASLVSDLEQRFDADLDAAVAVRRAAWSSSATKVDLAARRAAHARG